MQSSVALEAVQPPSLGNDRRMSARSPLFMLVRTQEGSPLWAWDIGLGGMQCKSRRLLWPGTYLDLSFALPGADEVVRVGAQVLSLDHDDDGSVSLGLRFCRLSRRAELTIYRFMDRRRHLWSEDLEPEVTLPELRLEDILAKDVAPELPQCRRLGRVVRVKAGKGALRLTH